MYLHSWQVMLSCRCMLFRDFFPVFCNVGVNAHKMDTKSVTIRALNWPNQTVTIPNFF